MKQPTSLTLFGCAMLLIALPSMAAHTPSPSTVTIAGSLQSELGCSDDWQPACATTHLTADAEDRVWQGTFEVPAGNWEYKAAVNDSWQENYGALAQQNGANISLNLSSPASVKFYYDHATHWVTSNRNSLIATAPGSYQSEIGCSGDWQPGCLRSWLEDPDGDDIYTMRVTLPAGSYEVKVAINESFSENYGAGGLPNGATIPFTVPTDCAEMLFSYVPTTHVLTVTTAPAPPQPSSVTVTGSMQSELGCSDDWQPGCSQTHLSFIPEDMVWQATFDLPAGSFEYKAALNDSWSENYGYNAQPNGSNILLNLASNAAVKFYYDNTTHWITTDRNSVIATAAGSFQSELGCPGDWDPQCLRSWLQDPEGDGIYTFTATGLPAGNYETKVAINESWSENYGSGGAPNGNSIAFTVPTACTPVVFSYVASTHVLTVTAIGAPVGNINLAKAHWVTEDTIAWNPDGFDPGGSFVLHYASTGGLALDSSGVMGGSSVSLTYDSSGLPSSVIAKFPHLAGFHAFRIAAADLALVPAILQGQIAVSAEDLYGNPVDATGLQIPGVLDDLYTYTGPLGATFSSGTPTIRVWAPTAQSVTLELFDDSAPSTTATDHPMTREPGSGVWTVTGSPEWYAKYYLYDVEVYVPSTGDVEHNLVTDPYSVSLSTNSTRTQIIDLDDASLKPAGWDALVKPVLEAPEDISIYELHVRDFSSGDESVPSAYRGTFKAFTELGSNGMLHLSALAAAGLTHIQLLPAFDIASVNEDRSSWQEPAGDLASYPADSDQQQAAVRAVAGLDGFNWGYDPWHYTVPEGSYSTDPDGQHRIVEFREMVKALSTVGLRVVMDVVYNHTTAAGQNERSVLDRIVPGYYHRLDADGVIENSTCCENTATEHAMMEKLMVDSVVTWAKEYKVDGFRFDLMGHHMKSNILNVRSALDALTSATDGVDGSRIHLYGEGWNFGEVRNDVRGTNATQLNMAGTGIGTFSDRLRDGVRGGDPFSAVQDQGFLTGLSYDPNATNQGSATEQLNRLLLQSDWIRIGLAGNLASYTFVDRLGNVVAGHEVDYNGQPAGYTEDPQENIGYLESHDGETLFDAIQLKAAAADSMSDRVRMQNLGMSILAFGQGIPFFHGGVDMLRSKSLDRNSYDSGDWFNRLDFTYGSNNWGVGLPPAADNLSNWPIMGPLLANPALMPAGSNIASAVVHLREVLAIRRSSKLFRLRTAADIGSRVTQYNVGPAQIPGLIVMSIADAEGVIDPAHKLIVVVLNANDEPQTFASGSLASKNLLLHPVLAASADTLVRTSSYSPAGAFFVPGRTAVVFWQVRPSGERLAMLKDDVRLLYTGGYLDGKQYKGLIAKLDAAVKALQKTQIGTAINNLEAFRNQVRDLLARGILTPAQAQPLLDEAAAIIAQIR